MGNPAHFNSPLDDGQGFSVEEDRRLLLSEVRKLLTARLVPLQPTYSSSMRSSKWIRMGPATKDTALGMLIRLNRSRRSRPVLSNAQVMDSLLGQTDIQVLPQFAAP